MKNKTLKKVTIAVIMLVMMLAFSACGKKDTIVGTWVGSQNNTSYEYAFNQDGTGSYTISDLSPIKFTYTTEGNALSITTSILGSETTEKTTYTLEAGKLTIKSNDAEVTFEKK